MIQTQYVCDKANGLRVVLIVLLSLSLLSGFLRHITLANEQAALQQAKALFQSAQVRLNMRCLMT